MPKGQQLLLFSLPSFCSLRLIIIFRCLIIQVSLSFSIPRALTALYGAANSNHIYVPRVGHILDGDVIQSDTSRMVYDSLLFLFQSSRTTRQRK